MKAETESRTIKQKVGRKPMKPELKRKRVQVTLSPESYALMKRLAKEMKLSEGFLFDRALTSLLGAASS